MAKNTVWHVLIAALRVLSEQPHTVVCDLMGQVIFKVIVPSL
jgi:hypothetical protein